MESFNGISYYDLLIRYANNYGLEADELTIEMVLKHWTLEKFLTKQLLTSTPQNRKTVFFDAYNTLYNELPWLQKTGSIDKALSEQVYKERWHPLLGEVKGMHVYEIGSGNGNLINSISSRGAFCVGTEISESRPGKGTTPNMEWHNTDGVNLNEYEPDNYYELVISDQVIEHLHPDDIDIHLKSVNAILKPGGRYIFYTPHYYIGPGDISRIFGCSEAEGMHLKEYKYAELYKSLKSAGFFKIRIPIKSQTKVHYLYWVRTFLFLECGLNLIKSLSLRKRLYRKLAKLFHISNEIVMIAQK